MREGLAGVKGGIEERESEELGGMVCCLERENWKSFSEEERKEREWESFVVREWRVDVR